MLFNAKKNMFVDRIMHMSEASQAQLMLMIDEVMKSQNSFGEEEEGDEYSEQDEEEDSKYENILKERDELLERVTELEKSWKTPNIQTATRPERKRNEQKAESWRDSRKPRTLSRREITFQDTIRTCVLCLMFYNSYKTRIT